MLDRKAVGTILSKLVFLISVPPLRASETRCGLHAECMGIDNESNQVN